MAAAVAVPTVNVGVAYDHEAQDVGPASFHIRKVVDPRVDYEDLATIDKEYLGYVGAMYWNQVKRMLLVGMIQKLNGRARTLMDQVP